MTITPWQVQQARAELGWSRKRVSEASDVPEESLAAFEGELRPLNPHKLAALRETFEEAGLAFDDQEDGNGL